MTVHTCNTLRKPRQEDCKLKPACVTYPVLTKTKETKTFVGTLLDWVVYFLPFIWDDKDIDDYIKVKAKSM